MNTRLKPATEAEIARFLESHTSWSLAEGKLHRAFDFADFSRAFGFMAEAALVAERNNHHPEWCNVYRRVTVDLVTHEAGGITTRDFALAAAMDDIASRS